LNNHEDNLKRALFYFSFLPKSSKHYEEVYCRIAHYQKINMNNPALAAKTFYKLSDLHLDYAMASVLNGFQGYWQKRDWHDSEKLIIETHEIKDQSFFNQLHSIPESIKTDAKLECLLQAFIQELKTHIQSSSQEDKMVNDLVAKSSLFLTYLKLSKTEKSNDLQQINSEEGFMLQRNMIISFLNLFGIINDELFDKSTSSEYYQLVKNQYIVYVVQMSKDLFPVNFRAYSAISKEFDCQNKGVIGYAI